MTITGMAGNVKLIAFLVRFLAGGSAKYFKSGRSVRVKTSEKPLKKRIIAGVEKQTLEWLEMLQRTFEWAL